MLRTSFTKLATNTASRSVAAAAAPRSLDWNPRWLSSSSDGALCDKLAFIGTGKMAQSMIRPLIQKGYQPEDKVAIYDVSTSSTKAMKKEFGQIQIADSISDLVSDADYIVCAVKPQNINEKFWQQFPSDMKANATFISIMAGVPIEVFEPSGIPKIVRAMPNTPAQVGAGMTVWTCTPNLKTGERDDVQKLLKAFGEAIFVDEEKYVDMSTSISGSGPAYIFMLMEAMIDAGVHMGFSRDVATKLCYHTLLGSTLYAMETKEHPALLRNMVTSPAGTTASAIYELENGKFRVVINDAVWACYRRSLEMGGHDSAVGPGRSVDPEKQVIHHHYNKGLPSSEFPTSDSDSEDERA
eukprot:scaffold2141_cov120-Cylindrotheca_fusiformis.AAC.22